MADSINAGDRVLLMLNGAYGTVPRVDGLLAHVPLDSDFREKFVTAALKKIDCMAEDATD